MSKNHFLRKIYLCSKFSCVRSSHHLCARAHVHSLEGTLVKTKIKIDSNGLDAKGRLQHDNEKNGVIANTNRPKKVPANLQRLAGTKKVPVALSPRLERWFVWENVHGPFMLSILVLVVLCHWIMD